MRFKAKLAENAPRDLSLRCTPVQKKHRALSVLIVIYIYIYISSLFLAVVPLKRYRRMASSSMNCMVSGITRLSLSFPVQSMA